MSTERQADFYEAEPPQASRELAKLRASSDYLAPFEIVRRRVIDDVYDGKMTVDATLIIRIGDVEETEAASGVGVLHALDTALRKALLKYFPYLGPVKVIETYQHATGASTEADVVSVKKFADGDLVWTTLAKSSNTIESAWVSLLDGYEWRIIQENARLRRINANPKVVEALAAMSADGQAESVGKASPGKLAILYDGSCEMCRASLDGIRQFDNSGKMEPLDLHDEDVRAKFPELKMENLLEELHAVDEDGRVYRGARAINEILRRQRGLKGYLAYLWYIPGYAWLADRQYKRIAASRYERDAQGRLKSQSLQEN